MFELFNNYKHFDILLQSIYYDITICNCLFEKRFLCNTLHCECVTLFISELFKAFLTVLYVN